MPALKPLPKNLVLVVITVITAICFLVALGGLAKVHCERILPQYAAMTAFRRCSEFLTRTHAGHLSGYKLAPKATASQLAADCADGGWGGNPDTNVNEGLENISFGKRRRLLGVVDELCEKWYRSSWFHLFWGLIILVVWLFLAFKGYLDDLDIRITALAALIIG